MSGIGGIAQALQCASIDSRVLEDAQGSQALVCGYGARVLAWQPCGAACSVLGTHLDLLSVRSATDLDNLHAGPGGIRMLYAPEWAYCWKGEPDGLRFSNYVLQPAAAAGKWKLAERSRRCVTAETDDEIRDLIQKELIRFSVDRTVSLFSTPPQEVRGTAATFSGMSLQQRLLIRQAAGSSMLDLWNIVQVPKGSLMLFPVRPGSAPEIYFNASGKRSWRVREDLVEWLVTGDSETKWGLPVSAVTGRVGALIPVTGSLQCLLVWNHPVLPGLPYPDGPRPHYGRDQVVQSWDGFGFGEVEYHSPAATLESPLILDSSVLWAFIGQLSELREIARQLLGREIGAA